MRERAVPIIESRWVPNSPRDLFQVILRIGPAEANVRCGTGTTILEAVEDLAADIKAKSIVAEDDRFQEILGG